MRNITLRLTDETIDELEDESNEHGVSRSEYLRNLIATRNESGEHADRIEELEATINDLEQENERLHRERRQLLEQREENQELVEYVQEQRSLERKQDEREQEHQSRSILVRGWRYVFGRPTDDQHGQEG